MLSSSGAARVRDDESDDAEAESLLERVQGACDAVEALLDQIDTPAFVVDALGGVAHANLHGRRLLARERGAIVVALAEAVGGSRTNRPDEKRDAWRVRPFPGTNAPGRVLATLRSRTLIAHTREPLRVARRLWHLTKRQVEVLELVAARPDQRAHRRHPGHRQGDGRVPPGRRLRQGRRLQPRDADRSAAVPRVRKPRH